MFANYSNTYLQEAGSESLCCAKDSFHNIDGFHLIETKPFILRRKKMVGAGRLDR